jgi:hypothetical protein
MPFTNLEFKGLVLSVEYTTDAPDETVGYSGDLVIEQVFIDDTDVTLLVLDAYEEQIRELIMDKE